MIDAFPPVDELLELETEDIGPFLLKYLNAIESDPQGTKLNRHNFTLETNPALQEYAKDKIANVAKVLTEAWIWLEKEGCIAPLPGQTGDWAFITRRGKKLSNPTDPVAYKFSDLIPIKNLDPILAQKVRPLFIRGNYDDAVFQAYKEVEVRIRKAGGYRDDVVGVDLARKAFHPVDGPLTDKSRVKSENESIMHLFSGALGFFKNPGSHRNVNFDNPPEVAEILLFANYLLRVVDSRTPDGTLQKQKEGLAVRP